MVCYQAADALGNTDYSLSGAIAGIDTTPPTITITEPDTSPALSKTITASASDYGTLTMSNITGLPCDDSLTFVAYSSQTFSSEPDNGTMVCYQAADALGNTDYSLSGAIAGIDTTPPSVTSFTLKTPATSPTNADTLTFLATFSEPVTDVDIADFVKNSTSTATVTDVSQVTNSTYAVTISGGDLASFNGDVNLNLSAAPTITDQAGNPLPADEPSTDDNYTVENTAPSVVSSERANPNPTNAASVNFTVTFSDPVTSVDVTDFILTATGVSGASVTGVSGSGNVYTVTANTGSGDGTIRLDVPTSAIITNLGGIPLIGLPYTGGETYTINKLLTIFLPLILR